MFNDRDTTYRVSHLIGSMAVRTRDFERNENKELCFEKAAGWSFPARVLSLLCAPGVRLASVAASVGTKPMI